MKKISKTLYLDVEAITAVNISKMTYAAGTQIKHEIVVSGQKMNITEQEWEKVKELHPKLQQEG